MLSLNILVPTVILICGVVNDIKSRKVKNWLVLACAAASLLFVITYYGFGNLPNSLYAFATALILCLPFVLTRIMGAGDMKLFAAFALAVSIPAVINSFIYSLFWGALLGLFRAIVGGDIKNLVSNTTRIVQLKKTDMEGLHQIPYTVALLFGWLTYVSLSRFSGLQLW